MEADFIPAMGKMVDVDLSEEVPNADGTGTKMQRIKLPADTINWVIEALQSQGSSLESLEGLGPGVKANIAGKFNQQQGGQGQ